MTIRLLQIVSHPIQYQAPLFRRIAAEPGINFRVLFLRDTEDGYFDAGFGRDVRWDVPLRSGYESAVWKETGWRRQIRESDAVWLHGWQGAQMIRAMDFARAQGKPILMRGENNDCAMPDGTGVRGWLKRQFLGFVFSRCDVFLSIGGANRNYYERRGVAPGRIVEMGYAVDNDFFAAGSAAAMPRRDDLRRALGLDGRPVILYAGKFIPRKHPEWLLRAWREAPWPGARP
ncbi:MAG: glycosyltransferase family 4 protein, partial [Alphaproteobacteria bacterium]|nr:glycosyltransferase family 4 protein [Alphaproteobacteria bacterium]